MKLSIQIASVPHREDLVAEVWAETTMLAEVYFGEDKNLKVEIYGPNSAEYWNFDYDKLIDAFEKAKKQLVKQGSKS